MQVEKEMDKRKTEKATCLAIASLSIIMSLLHIADWHSVGIYSHCPFYCRLIYPFFHANIFHALLNCWCFIAVVFIYDITILRLLIAYIIAVTFPIDFVSSLAHSSSVTVGMSGVIYTLFGSISFNVERKLHYQSLMLFYVCIGFIMPGTNALIHLYCYICGLVIALLNKPIKVKR